MFRKENGTFGYPGFVEVTNNSADTRYTSPFCLTRKGVNLTVCFRPLIEPEAAVAKLLLKPFQHRALCLARHGFRHI